MTKHACLLVACGTLGFLPLAGCLWVSSPVVWTEEVTDELRIETADLARLEARTHNGAISYTGHVDHEPAAIVLVTKKGGGSTGKDAQDALQAIDVYVEKRGSKAKRLAWRWSRPRKNTWGARVSYKIDAPANLALDAQTHNGAVDLSGIEADATVVTHNGSASARACKGNLHIVTHNGGVEVESSGGSLYAETHNGRINADYGGRDLALRTHNGRVHADLGDGRLLGGSIVSHNGGITLAVGEELSADLTCATHNGTIRSDVPWQVHEVSRRKVVGRLGQGGPTLTATTHNGSIRIKGKRR